MIALVIVIALSEITSETVLCAYLCHQNSSQSLVRLEQTREAFKRAGKIKTSITATKLYEGWLALTSINMQNITKTREHSITRKSQAIYVYGDGSFRLTSKTALSG